MNIPYPLQVYASVIISRLQVVYFLVSLCHMTQDAVQAFGNVLASLPDHLMTMNRSQESDGFLATCNNSKGSYVIVDKFPNKTYEHSRIAVLVINCILFCSTVSLNAISVITIKKSSQLRSKVCYFVIALQSVVDLGVGVVSIPLFIYYLFSPFLNTANCTFITFALGITFLPCGFSIITQSAMTMERYIGVLHPYSYQTQVTKKRILVYVSGSCLALLSVISSRDREIIKISWAVMILTFFFFTGFVYTRIYLIIRKLVRSEKGPACESDKNQNSIRRRIFHESRHARSCFLVVVCFGIFMLPLTLSSVFFKIGSIEYIEYFSWAVTSMILNSSVNSLIFFWTKSLLRKEAFRIFKFLSKAMWKRTESSVHRNLSKRKTFMQ